MEEALCDRLRAWAAEIGVPLGEDELGRFALFQRELLLWNRRINLISGPSAREVALRHFVDSLTPLPWLNPKGSLIDLGTGGGFPGLPLKIVLPDLQLTLVEASRKKSSFLTHVVRTLALKRVTVVQERIENLVDQQPFRGLFETVVSRAAFKLPELIPMASFFLSPGGRLIALKGPDPREEMADAVRVLAVAGMTFEACRQIQLPEIKSTRNLIIYKRAPLRDPL